MSEGHTPVNEPARDVLAAEAFAVPAPDPVLRHQPIELPADPTGITEPHDILAAEEFALPAPRPTLGGALARRAPAPQTVALAMGLVALGLILLRRSKSTWSI